MARPSARGPKSNKQTMIARLPRPLDHQIRVLSSIKRYKIIAAGRRWGKTMMSLIAVVSGHGSGDVRFKGAIQGGDIWWIAPTYGIASLIWRDLKRALANVWTDKREDQQWILLPGGGSITVKSADNPDSLRGAGLDGVVLDECAYMKEEVWNECLRPALADKKGWAIFISTPKMEDPMKKGEGVEWFKTMFKAAETKNNWERWQRPSHDNPMLDRAELEELKEGMSDLAYRQEILAEFLDIGEGLFKRDWFRYYHASPYTNTYVLKTDDGIEECNKSECMFFCTVDLAAKKAETADYSVVATWAVTPMRHLLLIDIQRGHYTESRNKELIWEAYQKFNPSFIGIEAVAYQYSFVQEMQIGTSTVTVNGQHIRIPPLPVRELRPEKDKFARAQTISVHYKNGRVFHPDPAKMDKKWLNEYESEIVAFPNPKIHDDQVDCAAYAGVEISRPFYTGGEIPVLLAGGGRH